MIGRAFIILVIGALAGLLISGVFQSDKETTTPLGVTPKAKPEIPALVEIGDKQYTKKQFEAKKLKIAGDIRKYMKGGECEKSPEEKPECYDSGDTIAEQTAILNYELKRCGPIENVGKLDETFILRLLENNC
ncbi:MAG: hypothetical protein HY376_02295 [Candidatus Blackburnbacteria bacterium]|nr:hypothetical protein [Candidatus Blackburnbacteria bacterium]